MKRGMNNTDIKRSNRGLFLKYIALGQANSRFALSRATGLTKMTSGNIVQELLNQGLIDADDTQRSDASGPNPQHLTVSKSAPRIVGVYLSRDELVVSVGDLSGKLLYLETTSLKKETAQSVSEKLIQGVRKAIALQNSNVFAIGAAVIGPIDRDGAISNTPNFFGISYLPVKALLSDTFGLPVIVYNDTSAAAVAEQLIGHGRYRNFAYICIANGIAAGIINNGELLTSDRFFVGELGHTTIDFGGKPCPCGNRGCLELYANIPVICKRLESAVGHPVDVQDFGALAEIPACDAIFREVSEKLSAALINLANLVNPKAFIIGHNGYYIPEQYIKAMEQRVNQIKFMRNTSPIEVKKSFLTDRAAVYGSFCCVLREVFAGNILF